jgi:hypothetical protein
MSKDATTSTRFDGLLDGTTLRDGNSTNISRGKKKSIGTNVPLVQVECS